MAYFAWSRILIGAEVDKNTGIADKHQYVNVGEEVTPELLNVDQEQFDEYIQSGAIREYEYPDVPENYQDSPLNFFRDRIRDIESDLRQVAGKDIRNFGIAQRSLAGKLPEMPNGAPTTETTDATLEEGQQPAGTGSVNL